MVKTGNVKRILKTTTLLCAMQIPAVAFASEITLTSNDGALKFVGDLVEFTDGHYILSTHLGNISIGADGVTCDGEACPDLTMAAAEPAATAPAEFVGGAVSLQSFDGALKFEGDLIAIADGNYVVRTQLGDLKIATDSVTCVGAGCPNVEVTSLEPTVEEVPVAEPETMIVTLQSFDGDLKFVGELLDVTNGKYVIQTNLGELRVSASTVSCEGPACPEVGGEVLEASVDIEDIEIEYTIAGAEVIGKSMMPLLMSGYAATKNAVVEMKESPTVGGTIAHLVKSDANAPEIGAFLVSPTSTEDAFRALAAGDAQIAMASRRIMPGEANILRRSGGGDLFSPDQERVVALDNLVVVTHPNNPVDQISLEDLKAIYAGQITSWWTLGGPNEPITVIAPDQASASREFFEDRILGGQPTAEGANLMVASSDQDIAALVASDPYAIGYVGYAFQGATKAVSLESACGIPSVPDAFSTKTEEYLLGRRLYFYNRSDNLDADAADFLNFVVSEEADAMVARSGFINLDVARRIQGAGDTRAAYLRKTTPAGSVESGSVAELLASMAQNDRLSTTFRFQSGSVLLDEKSRGDLPRLIQYLQDLPEGAKVTLVGFTDSVGAFGANRNLSVNRARQARYELLAAAGNALDHLDVEVAGFGEVAPATCNDTADGRALNRRVEVWVSKDT